MPLSAWMVIGALLSADPLPDSFACLQRGDAHLSLEWEQRGCFHGRKGFVSVDVQGASARWQVTKDDARQNVEVSVVAARSLMEDFSSAATRAEKFESCMSTEQWHAVLRWQCQGQPPHEARFTTSSCGHDYARARGLIELAEGTK